MLQVKQGNAVDVLKTMDKESIDCVYMAPSPFGFYDNINKIGGEKSPMNYLHNLVDICVECFKILKKSGSLWVHMGDQFDILGQLMGLPIYFELLMRQSAYTVFDRIIWHRTENRSVKKYKERGFLKNYEFLFHFVDDPQSMFFNENSKYIKTSVHSYPLEDSYYNNEFDSGLPYQLMEMVIDSTCPPNGTVLDPICGSAKLGVVAKRMNRSFVGIDIDPEIIKLCSIRLGIES